MTFAPDFFSHAWEILVLFLVPIGGGIPAGVVIAQKYGVTWPATAFLYLISDIILACAFEPLMLLFIKKSKTVPSVAKVKTELAKTTTHLISNYVVHPGPFNLVMLTFGTDPMTGRALAKMYGRGFLAGWTLVIIGDMLFFAVIMASTIWLNSILGDGTWTAIIITVLIVVVPGLIRKWREKPTPPTPVL